MKSFEEINAVIEEYKQGKFVILVDDEDRENEGDLACAAVHCSAEKVNFMARFGRGLVCVALESARLDELGIAPMVSDNTSAFNTAFAVSVEARQGTTTGISAADRAVTIKKLIDPAAKASDFVKPGHTFPIRARQGGVLVRTGHTEAAVDLARLAGLYPAGVICEIMSEDGAMARMPQLRAFADEHALSIISIADLIRYRTAHERFVTCTATVQLPTAYGEFTLKSYEDTLSNVVHLAIQKGVISPDEPTLVRVHSECFTGDVLGSYRCDCGEQFHQALAQIGKHGGVFFIQVLVEYVGTADCANTKFG
ncbi:MAG: 3,4-dihydroxy-2-butanone-4-phosphate synthase [Chitinivibrionales bacterium]|nr:3,4-dihydroxy-2-butanone-4-phosphate synthase [Chitinivibrionales bacterium]